jgi:GT2 family glycosyltransferase
MTRPPSPTVSVVMPVYNGRSHLASSLSAVMGIDDPRLLEVIVVDDGSSDGSAAFAAELGASVLSSGGRQTGPAAARNVAARQAVGDLLVFIDADVVPHADALARIVECFDQPDVVAVFGSYDEHPRHPGFMSQYMNLRHHHGHQSASLDADTFWAGLGAVRRTAFQAVGGFDAERFPVPSVEDIELGGRLRAAGGRIRRDPSIQGKHLKQWSFAGVVHTDVFRRALPWAQLMLENPGAFGDLNLRASERLKAVLAGALAMATLLALGGLLSAWVPVALAASAWLATRSLTSRFAQTNGWWFALRALFIHQLYYLYSTAAYVLSVVRWHWLRRGGARGGGGAGPGSSG